MTIAHPNPQSQVGPDRKYMGQTYSEWVQSLNSNDPVRIRHPWEDLAEVGGRVDKGYVVKVNDGARAHWHVAVRFHNAAKGTTDTVAMNYPQLNARRCS